MKAMVLFLVAFGIVLPASATKRKAKVVAPVTQGDTTYTTELKHHRLHFEVHIHADKKGPSGKVIRLWDKMLYKGTYEYFGSALEDQIHLVSLELKENKLIAVDEWKKVYEVDPLTGVILSPKEPVVYKNGNK